MKIDTVNILMKDNSYQKLRNFKVPNKDHYAYLYELSEIKIKNYR
jgi:hypothetical protein